MAVKLALAMAAPVAAENWAVLVAGSSGFSNYRHQADMCHAYQVMIEKGMPAKNIITMAYDDVASSSENPFPGQLFNKPDPTGPGVDVYKGCVIDYKGTDVTPENYVNILTGKGSGKKLESTSDDNVFLSFFDHGAPGLIAFPHSEWHKADLQSTLQTMSDNKMFKKLVYYLEACESGSMFEGLSVPNVYAVSAANAEESSWGTYCGSDAMVNNKNVGSCLGDLFSVNWMEDSDAMDITKETLQKQFQTVQTKTAKSHVLQWGDLDFTSDDVAEYEGDAAAVTKPASENTAASAVSVRQVDLTRLYYQYTNAVSSEARIAAGKKLQAELNSQLAVEQAYTRFVQLAYPGDEAKQQKIMTERSTPNLKECELAVHRVFREHGEFDANSGFALQFHQYVVNMCADQSATGSNADLVALAKQAIDNSVIV